MDYIIWAVLMTVIWSNNEILNQHQKNKTKPSYNFWCSVMFETIGLVLWIINRWGIK